MGEMIYEDGQEYDADKTQNQDGCGQDTHDHHDQETQDQGKTESTSRMSIV